MKKELSSLFGILSISVLSISLLFVLLNKYAFLTFGHFVEVCRQITNNFLSSGLHHTGLVLSVITSFVVLIFVSKTILSYIKTKRKLASLIEKRTNVTSTKLLSMLKKNNISIDKIITVHSNEDIALTVGWLNPQIVLSSVITEKLNIGELESVVLHEYYHYKNKHPLMLLVGEILTSSLFFIPLLSDLNNKLRSTLEIEADTFVQNVQGKSNLLDSALSKMTNTKSFSFYPSFSRRSEYKVRKKNVVISLFVVLVGLVLYVFPIQTHAQSTTQLDSVDCSTSQQCSTHCDSDNYDKGVNMSVDHKQSVLTSSAQF